MSSGQMSGSSAGGGSVWPMKKKPWRADECRARRVGGAVEEGAVVAADEVLGALAQRVNAAVPPADGARAAEVVAELVTVAGDGREEALHGAGGHRQPVGGDRIEEGVADDRDRSLR